MASDPVDGNAQTRTPNKRPDDFDMAKLQKQLRHEQRRSSSSKHKAAKLSPAEIRSMNYNESAIKSAASRTNHRKSAKTVSSATPPQTPDKKSASQSAGQRKRHNTAPDLPTPPVSPPRERRGSNTSGHVIHAPQPVSHNQLVAYSTAPLISRSSSQTSYRGVATYRGPELTRSGSLTMFQRPSPEIVSNPLSNFSRPRQSTITSSPEKTISSRRQSEDSIASPVPRQLRVQTVDMISRTTSRQQSPIRTTDSPVSVDERRPLEKVAISVPLGVEVPVVRITPKAPPQVLVDDPSEPSAKQKLSWRKTLTSSSNDSEMAPLRKEYRRRTFVLPKAGYCLHAVNYADTKPGQQPLLRDTLRDELPSIRTSVFKSNDKSQIRPSEFRPHPAVRPLSQDGEQSSDVMPHSSASSSRKGKEREVDVDSIGNTETNSLSSSAFTRCDCCGRVVKPGGYASDLSPVLETDNIPSSLDSTVERLQPSRRRQSSSYDSNYQRFAPGSPVRVGDPYQQARLMESGKQPAAPFATASPVTLLMNKPGDVIGPSSIPLAIMPPSKTAPRFTRFGSLHAKKEGSPEETTQTNPPESEQSPNSAGLKRFGSLYGLNSQNNDGQSDAHTELEAQSQADSNLPSELPSQPQQQPMPSALSQMQNMSAYQAQQLRRVPPTSAYSHSSYHSASSSRQSLVTSKSKLSQEIYRENDDPIPDLQSVLSQNPSKFSTDTENTGTQIRPQNPNSANAPAQILSTNQPFNMPENEDDGEAVVDLSSFDGYFVHHSLSRSATVMKSMSPPSSSHGTEQQKQPQQTSPPRPARIDTSVAAAMSPDTTSDYTSASVPSSTQSQPQSVFYNAVTTNLPVATEAKASNVNPNQVENGEVVARRYPKTVVRLIPSPVIVSASASPISAGSKGQMKLGDWILPESPKAGNNSMNTSRSNLAPSSATSPTGVNGRIGVAA